MKKFVKVCKECGKTFETNSNRRMYCYDDHYRICTICGKSFFVPDTKLSAGRITCSEECRKIQISKKRKQASRQYECTCKLCGKTFFSSKKDDDICRSIHKQVCAVCGSIFDVSYEQLKYGKSTCSKACKYSLMKQHNLKKYGVENVFSVPEVQHKLQQTNLIKYGSTNPMQNFEIAQKSRNSRYAHIDEITETIREANLESYGYAWPMQNPEFRKKAQITCLDKYGVDNFAKSSKHIVTKLTDPNKLEYCEEFKSDPAAYIEKYFSGEKPTLAKIAGSCGMVDSSVGQIILNNKCQDLISYVFSKMESEVYEFLISTLPENTEILRNTFQIITPYELDIYVPDYKLAIECNPTVTHNSSFSGFGKNDSPKPKNYHKMKTDLCESKGIFLFHIFGYEWSYKKFVIQSMLRNLVHANEIVIYARKTEIQEVNSQEAYKFLVENHRQNGVNSKIRLGLYFQNELVSLMTFSKMRNTIGTGLDDLSNCWELVRFCSKCNTSVIGGASKLFKYFIENYHPVQIRSFSDRAHTKGSLYSKLGFKEIRRSDPGYVWVDTKTDRGYSRNNAQKQNIVAFLKDDSIDLSNTETQIMESHGYAQVFDSGTITWEWNRY